MTDFETLRKQVEEESKIEAMIQFTSYTVAAMSGELTAILKEKGILTDADMERIQNIGIKTGEVLRKAYEDIGKTYDHRLKKA